jgi:WD40 repeat protein
MFKCHFCCRTFKGSNSDDGTLIKVALDRSGIYAATSCTDKTVAIYDYYTGECMATMFGHSELVTGIKFTDDCKHLISVSGMKLGQFAHCDPTQISMAFGFFFGLLQPLLVFSSSVSSTSYPAATPDRTISANSLSRLTASESAGGLAYTAATGAAVIVCQTRISVHSFARGSISV